MPVAYTDIDFVTGVRNKPTAMPGMLQVHREIVGWQSDGTPITIKRSGAGFADTTDGLSNTICVIEDAGKNHEQYFPFMKANYADNCPTCVDKSPTNLKNNYRWAEPDNANGVSGPPNATVGNLKGVVNQNATPLGGPVDCPWSANNCGPNDEPFAFHSGGVNVLLGDGVGSISSADDHPATHEALVRSGGWPANASRLLNDSPTHTTQAVGFADGLSSFCIRENQTMSRFKPVGLLLLLVLTGCFNATPSQPNPVAVTVKVLMANGQPLKTGEIRLVPERGAAKPNKEVTAIGRPGSDDRFAVSTFATNDGTVPGKYLVVIRGVKGLNPKYGEEDTTDLKATVESNGGPIEISLAK